MMVREYPGGGVTQLNTRYPSVNVKTREHQKTGVFWNDGGVRRVTRCGGGGGGGKTRKSRCAINGPNYQNN